MIFCVALAVASAACSSVEESLHGSWGINFPELPGTGAYDTRGPFVYLKDGNTYTVSAIDRDNTRVVPPPLVPIAWGTWTVESNVLIFRPDPISDDCTVPSGDGSTLSPQIGRYAFELFYDDEKLEERSVRREDARRLELTVLDDECTARRNEMVHGLRTDHGFWF